MPDIIVNSLRRDPSWRVEVEAPKKEWRVVLLIDGARVSAMNLDEAMNFMRLVKKKARLAHRKPLESEKELLIARTRGTVAAIRGRVVFSIDASNQWSYSPQHAMDLSKAILKGHDVAARELWNDIDKFHTGGVKTKRVMGVDVVESRQQYERAG